jgi:hypothetical protein
MAPKTPPRAPAAPAGTVVNSRGEVRATTVAREPAPSALALAPNVDDAAVAALAAAGIDIEEDDTCAELQPSDFKTAMKLFNMKGKAADGSQRRQDRFYDSITSEEQETVEFAILGLHKSNQYGVYDNGEGRTNRVCSSFDQVTGIWAEDGHQRKCEGCPDKRATKQADGKVRSNCAEMVDLMCVELENTRVFALRGKRTSRPPIMNYLHQHHFAKGGTRNGKRTDLPLYAYRVTASLEMEPGGNYAQLSLDKGDIFSSNDLKVLKESAVGVRETLAERLNEVEAQATAAEGGSSTEDTSFGYGANAEAQKFVSNAP